MMADQDVAQHLGSGPDNDVVAQGRMALALLITGAAERHALVEQHIVADLGGFPDDHAGAVVDEEPPPDGCARMDLDARKKAAELRNNPGYQG